MLSSESPKDQGKIDSFVNDHKNIKSIIVAELEKQLRNIWVDLRTTFVNYENDTKHRRKAYAAIKEKDEKDQLIITQQLVHSTTLSETVWNYREKISAYQAHIKDNINKIMIEYNFFHKSYWFIKNRFLSDQKLDQNQLMTISIEFNHSAKHLRKIVSKADNLVKLLQICYKYETENEIASQYAESVEVTQENLPTMVQCGKSEQIAKDFQYLTPFWKRLAKARIIMEELRLKRESLHSEAQFLQNCLKQYLAK